jgi:glucose dehydrogenase
MDTFDLCIIGSGVAGGLLASELAATGKRIALVEAGTKHDRRETQRRIAAGGAEPYFVHNDERLHVPVSVDTNFGWAFQQAKKVGGNSIFWGAWAVRPVPNHFTSKARYGVGADWPLRYEALEPFYGAAEEELGVAGRDQGPYEPPRSKPYPMPAFPISYADEQFARACSALGFGTHPIPVARTSRAYRDRPVCCLAAQCWTCPTEAKYSSDVTHVRAAAAAPNVTLIENAFASRVELDARGRAAVLRYARPDRSEGALTAGAFVVACNAIESARLLLQSAQKGHPAGLANGSGQAGRNLMVHPSADVIAFAGKPILAARSWPTLFTRHFEDGEHRRSHAGFRLAPMPGPPPSAVARDLLERGLFGQELRGALRGGMATVFRLLAEIEMLPSPSNRVELDPEHRDHFGNPGLRVAVKLGDYERGCWQEARKAMAGIVEGMGGKANIGDPFWTGGGHQMGTLKMGTDKKTSVVDPNLRAHEVPNLYVASTAAFPSSLGPTNPTLTLAALTLRLAARLRGELKGGAQ